MCRDSSDFIKVGTSECGKLNFAYNSNTEIKAKGIASLIADVNGQFKKITLKHALHVPDLRTNLISVSEITDNGFHVYFDD